MIAILSDLLRQSTALFKVIRIVGDEQTTVHAINEDKTLFLVATTKQPIDEFKGEFAIMNLSLLEKLLAMPSYRSETARFLVRREHPTRDTVTMFELQDGSGKGCAKFRTTAPELAGEKATIGDIPWDVSFVPSKAKIAEFSSLGSLFTEVNVFFGARVHEGDLVLNIGEDSRTTHSVDLVFASGLDGDVNSQLQFATKHFLTVLKLAGNHPTKVMLTSKGIMGISVETAMASYMYYLRAKR